MQTILVTGGAEHACKRYLTPLFIAWFRRFPVC